MARSYKDGKEVDIPERAEQEILERRDEFRSLCSKLEFKVGNIKVSINPVTTLLGGIVLWAVIIWVILETSESIKSLNSAQKWITDKCTWFYVSSQFVYVLLIFYVFFKYGHIKLGLTNDIPEYGNFDYFAMIFTTGICNGLFYDSANAPIVGYSNTTDNLQIYRGKSTRIAQAQNSLNVVMLHWGFHGFAVYVLPCLLMSILCYRKGLPLTMRSCFYPVFGRKIFGRLGDLVDSISIVCMGFAVSTSFLLGTVMLVIGAKNLVPDMEINFENKMISLWCICFLAMLSAGSGLSRGIRRMSELCFLIGVLFTMIVAFSDDFWYLLNLAVQSIGHYFQFIIGSSTHTAAFVQKGTYPGSKKEEIEWMHKNTVFYWGWWLGWAPLVAVFATRISKGRTIKNVIINAFLVPSFLNFIWFVVIGGVAIDMENRAISAQLTCDSVTENRTDIPKWLRRLGCIDSDNRFFYVVEKYEDIVGFLHVLAFLITILYFITSYDSAALVMGSISSNGNENPPLIQRFSWCVTIGACTSMLLLYEKEIGKTEIYAFAILAGVPFAIVMCLCGIALWRLLKLEPNWSYELLEKWSMFYGNINSLDLLKKCLLAIVIPWYFLASSFIKEKQENRKLHKHFTHFRFALPFYLWIGLLFLRIQFTNMDHIAWALFAFFLVQGSMLRRRIRRRLNIEGNVFEDTALMVIYPLTSVQMYEQLFPQITKNTHMNGAITNGGFDLADLRELDQRGPMSIQSVIMPMEEAFVDA